MSEPSKKPELPESTVRIMDRMLKTPPQPKTAGKPKAGDPTKEKAARNRPKEKRV